MNQNLTQIVFILDKSGSMAGLTSDTIGGYNAFVKSQKELTDGKAIMTTVLFSTGEPKILHNGIDIMEVPELTTKEYVAGGGTALLDAIGETIQTVQDKVDELAEEDRPARTIFVITTDGEENSSRKYLQPQVKKMIEHQTNGHSWDFIFLGANIDAVTTAQNYGINLSSGYSANARGIESVYTSVCDTVSSVRLSKNTSAISEDWSKNIE